MSAKGARRSKAKAKRAGSKQNRRCPVSTPARRRTRPEFSIEWSPDEMEAMRDYPGLLTNR
jgi:hypothetical protein